MKDGIFYDNRLPGADEIHGFYQTMGWAEVLGKSREQLHSAIAGSHILCCAWEGGRLVGMGRVVSDGHLCAYVCGLGVLEGYRGRGIGRRMMEDLLNRCREQGLAPQLFCGAHLVPHYEKLGFAAFGVGMQAGWNRG